MSEGDFFENEKSVTLPADTKVSVELHTREGAITQLKKPFSLKQGEVLDATFMSVGKLREFFSDQMKLTKDQGLLYSLHMKATMMKVSDPIIFGHAVSVYFDSVFNAHKDSLASIGVDERNGFGDVLSRLDALESSEKSAINADIQKSFEHGPAIAMVDSDKGITNLHVPSDIIIDASMPAAIRSSGKMWNSDGALQDTNFIIPDRCYAGIYAKTVDFCKENGAFDPSTMGSVSNVGLMAQKAEEYGSHDKTFEIPSSGVVKVIDSNGTTLIEHAVEKGDIWRACQVKDAVIERRRHALRGLPAPPPARARLPRQGRDDAGARAGRSYGRRRD